jgi:hypothetical protein
VFPSAELRELRVVADRLPSEYFLFDSATRRWGVVARPASVVDLRLWNWRACACGCCDRPRLREGAVAICLLAVDPDNHDTGGRCRDRLVPVTPAAAVVRGLRWIPDVVRCSERQADPMAAPLDLEADLPAPDGCAFSGRAELSSRARGGDGDTAVERPSPIEVLVREALRDLDDAATEGFESADRLLLSGCRRSKARSDSARSTVSAAWRSMLGATPSGRAIVISRPSIVTVRRESWARGATVPPRRRISSVDGPLARASMRPRDPILWWATE